jgi:protein-L-isoaspartate(D-aspartate) O-methyltransferase
MQREDNFRHKGLRKKLLESLYESGIHNEDVLKAIYSIPRHLFFDPIFEEEAYLNKAFPIGCKQTISHPYTVAYQSQALEIKSKDRVLEIGTGSGYQTCVLCALGAKVYTIERFAELSKAAQKMVRSFGYMPYFAVGDGTLGLPRLAPFDKIIVTAGAPAIHEKLIEQLNFGGKMIIPVGSKEIQTMKLIEKDMDGKIKELDLENFKFVPLIGSEGW